MFNPTEGIYKQFLKSPHHIGLACATIGLGFLSANMFLLAVGVAAYALGWIYLPDSSFFTSWVKRKSDAISNASSQQQVEAFQARRRSLLSQLSTDDRDKYDNLSSVCADIERATKDAATTSDPTDPRLRKIDELMWTYLKLLALHGSLQSFLDTERGDGLSRDIDASQKEIDALTKQETDAVAKGEPSSLSRGRLIGSKKDRLDTLKQRLSKISEARDNLELVAAEQDRLAEQIKLLRADTIATRNPETLSARIDVTMQNLTTTNEMMSQMNQFKELVSDDLPPTTARLGFSTQGVENTSSDDDQPAYTRNRRRTAARN